MPIFFKNIRIIDLDTDKITNILITDNYFNEIKNLNNNNIHTEIIDGEGLALMPSFVDLHCHLRDPGYTYKEDLLSGQQAALSGGYTTICCMANTLPVCDNPDTIGYILNKTKNLNLCNVIPVSAVTRNLKTTEMVDFKSMTKHTFLFSNDGEPIVDKKTMVNALQASLEYNFKLLTHCEPEIRMVERDLELLKSIGGNLHICHVSQKESVQLIRDAKKDGLKITCEVTPHHLISFGLDYIVHPPFREKKDTEALLEGLLDGTIDIIATDHAPHNDEDKVKGARGLIGLEHSFSLVYTLFKKNNLDIKLLSKFMSYRPSVLLGIPKTIFSKKSPANFVLVNLDKKYTINDHNLYSKSKNTPYVGKDVYGQILMTLKNGEIKYDNRQIV